MTITTDGPLTTSEALTREAGEVAVFYQLSFERFTQHLVDVKVNFKAVCDAPVLWLPSWIPGSYLMREFSRHVTAVNYAYGSQSEEIKSKEVKSGEIKNKQPSGLIHSSVIHSSRGIKLSKNQWQLPEVSAGDDVVLRYEVYCYDLSVRTAYVDQFRLYGNFTSLALAVEGLESQPVRVWLEYPDDFMEDKDMSKMKLACGLPHTQCSTEEQAEHSGQRIMALKAPSYHELIDYPFELAEQDEFDFIVTDKAHKTLPHRFFISGRHQANLGRLQQDVRQICQSYVSWLGDAPFEDYTFMTFASGNDYGGLEHINSTSLITPRADLPSAQESDEPSADYQRFLGLCSHEYFHAWWVKTVRPDVMLNVDLQKEAYTPLLWVFEGFTSYIDDFMLQASGVISHASYLKLLEGQINRYEQTAGRMLQTVAESSFDAWIKLYRADENTGNAGISYYNKGALVALCLDLTLLKHSGGKYRVFDVVKRCYEQAKGKENCRIGVSVASIGEVISELIPKAVWQEFEEDYINGLEPLPLDEMLAEQGVVMAEDEVDSLLPWGIRCEETPAGLKVSRVLRDSVAADAGLSAQDVIVAIDGIKASAKQLQRAARRTDVDVVVCHAFRRDELIELHVPMHTLQGTCSSSHLNKIKLSMKAEGWEAWLAAPSA